MGLKLCDDCNAIPVELEDGVLRWDIGRKGYTFDIPELRGITIPKQCNMFICDNVAVFLEGKPFSVILRRDGTGTLFVAETGVLYCNFQYNQLPLGKIKKAGGGCITDIDSAPVIKSFVQLYSLDGENWVFSCQLPFSGTFTKCDEVAYANDATNAISVGLPTLRIYGTEIMAYSGTTFETMYKLNMELNRAQGFRVL